MRDSLLGNMATAPLEGPVRTHRRRLPRLRGGNGEVAIFGIGCVGCCAVVIATIIGMCVQSVSPLEWGLLRNWATGKIEPIPYTGRLKIVSPMQQFVTFPKTRVTLEFSKGYEADQPAVTTRTGADPKDPDSGGQPIGISCAVQFQLIEKELTHIYLNFNSYKMAKVQYVRRAFNMVSVTAQEFTPQDFWTERSKISERMLAQIASTLEPLGARAISFEIISLDFAASFENSITGIQVAQQQKVVNEYAQQVQQVQQQINVLNSHNQAYIASIQAGADKTSKEKVGNATKSAFIMKQQAKAEMYFKLQKALEFTPAQMAEYIKIRSMMAQSSTGKVVVNIPPPLVAGEKKPPKKTVVNPK